MRINTEEALKLAVKIAERLQRQYNITVGSQYTESSVSKMQLIGDIAEEIEKNS